MSEKYQTLDNKMVGQVIKSIRKSRKMTISEFSARTGICRSYITMVEHGAANPSVEVIAALFAGLDKQIVFGVKKQSIEAKIA